MTLSAFAGERGLQATGYRSLSAAGVRAQQQTSRTPLLPSIDGTDGRTDTRPLHRPAPHTTQAAAIRTNRRSAEAAHPKNMRNFVLISGRF